MASYWFPLSGPSSLIPGLFPECLCLIWNGVKKMSGDRQSVIRSECRVRINTRKGSTPHSQIRDVCLKHSITFILSQCDGEIFKISARAKCYIETVINFGKLIMALFKITVNICCYWRQMVIQLWGFLGLGESHVLCQEKSGLHFTLKSFFFTIEQLLFMLWGRFLYAWQYVFSYTKFVLILYLCCQIKINVLCLYYICI